MNYFRGADDRASYVNLLKELRLAFEGEAKTSGQPRLLLTAAVPASFEAIAAGSVNSFLLSYLFTYVFFFYELCLIWLTLTLIQITLQL